MKWVAGMVVAMIVVSLIHLGLAPTRSPLPVHDDSIHVVTAPDRSRVMPVASGPERAVPMPMVAPPPLPEKTSVTRTDTEALAELFDAQARDPAWAPEAEAEVRSHMPAGGEVRCAEFMCRVAMPLPDRSMTVSADRQADTVSRHWSTDLSYNRLTATIVSDRQVPTLIFYVTRSADGSQVM